MFNLTWPRFLNIKAVIKTEMYPGTKASHYNSDKRNRNNYTVK